MCPKSINIEVAQKVSLFHIIKNCGKAKAYNTCIAPQVTYRDFRGAGTTQARKDVQPIGCRPGPQTRASLTAKKNHKHSPSLPFNGLHPRNPRK